MNETIKYKDISENLEGGMKDLNKALREMPHIIVGNKKDNIPSAPIFNEKEQKVINQIKKWALILVVLLVIGYASYKIVKVFLW